MKEKTIKLVFDTNKLETESSFDFIGVDRGKAIEIREYIRENMYHDWVAKEIKHLLEKYNDAEVIVALINYGYGL